MTREEKNLFIETLDGMLNENNNFYLTDTSGLNAEETSNLRAPVSYTHLTLPTICSV